MLRLNGKAVEGGVAPFDLADRGLTLGDGLFETIAVFGGRPALLGAHLDRLWAAAAEIRLPVDRAFCEAEVLALAREAGQGDAVVRLTVTRGAGARGLALTIDAKPNIIVTSAPYPKGALNAPIRLATVSVRRNPTSFASRAKTLSYLDNVLAFDEAQRLGADDALMLNTDGRVASTSMANLFVIVGDALMTPPVGEGALPGIVRTIVLNNANDVGLRVEERSIGLEMILSGDGVFATNSVRQVMSVTAIDGNATISGAEQELAKIIAAVAVACGNLCYK